MATRSLTDVFILMRNNASQNRHIYSEQHVSDSMALVSETESGMEMRYSDSRLPGWADTLEETHYALSRLKGKLEELSKLYDKHLLRPTLDDSSAEEHQIEILTQEITRMFGSTHRLVQQIRQQSSYGRSRVEQQLSKNVTASLISSLQELSTTFRKLQNTYLKKLNSREERSRQYFDTVLDLDTSDKMIGDLEWGGLTSEAENIDRQFSYSTAGGIKCQTQAQLLLLEEENTRMAAHHEAEVQGIVKSIVDLNEIFKDLSHMVVEQGTVLDRIDYNVEQTQIQVYQGYQQLQKADAYQRKNRKMMCILILSAVTILLTCLLIIVKT